MFAVNRVKFLCDEHMSSATINLFVAEDRCTFKRCLEGFCFKKLSYHFTYFKRREKERKRRCLLQVRE